MALVHTILLCFLSFTCLQGAHHPSRLPGAVREWLNGQYIPFTEPVPGTLHLQL